MAGTILDGKIQAGMFVRITCNSALGLTARIHSIELVRRTNGEDVCLCIQSEPKQHELFRSLNIADQTVEVVLEAETKS